MRTEQEIQAATDDLEASIRKADHQNSGKMIFLLAEQMALNWCLGKSERLHQWKETNNAQQP